jgi:uncharacterized protein YqjF (DUF2071 family)
MRWPTCSHERPAEKGNMVGGLEVPAIAPGVLSRTAKERMLSQSGEPLFLADWVDTLMLHLEVDPAALQQATPFPLDLFNGRAFVSLVFFTMRRMRPRLGGRIGEWLLRPIATHEFLNVRTYVECNGEPGIHFLAEWLPNAFSVRIGPPVFGLPYRLGRMEYKHSLGTERHISGQVMDRPTGTSLSYRGELSSPTDFVPCAGGSLDEWLMERYTAFTHRHGVSRFFRVWHPPWPQVPAHVELTDDSLLRSNWPWLAEATHIGANYSPGFRDVWIGRPNRC